APRAVCQLDPVNESRRLVQRRQLLIRSRQEQLESCRSLPGVHARLQSSNDLEPPRSGIVEHRDPIEPRLQCQGYPEVRQPADGFTEESGNGNTENRDAVPLYFPR